MRRSGRVNLLNGAGSSLTALALKKDGLGEAIAIGPAGISLSVDYGVSFPTTVPLAQGEVLNDVAHLAGTKTWIAVGDNGLVRRITRTAATITTEVIPIGTSAKLVGVDASESDSDVLWVVSADGTAFFSRVGARL